jgi:sodium transport system permease protein
MSGWRAGLAVFRKEWIDALRDRRTLIVVLLSSVLLGPVVMVALSGLLASFETQAERRVIVVDSIEHAPGLRNFLERQAYTVREADFDYESELRRSTLSDPVVVIPPRFEADLVAGRQPRVEVVTDSGNRRAQANLGRVGALLNAYVHERVVLDLALRGVAPELLSPIRVSERDLASTQSRAAQWTGMLPFFVIMAVLYGALNAALDTTAGERERGSLEPLLMNPVDLHALAFGKWGAVAGLAMLIAVLSCLSFLPAQYLMRSPTLQALFQFGWREVAGFLGVLLPLAAALSAWLMAVAIRCKTFKEAQASSTVLVLAVSLLPLVTTFNQEGEAGWHLWVPALAQFTLMTRVLKGEAFGVEHFLVPLLVCAVLTAVGLWIVVRLLRQAAVR